MSATISSMGNMDPILGKNPGNRPSNEAPKASTAAPATKPLWAAIGILSVSLLAMGASLIHISKRPAEPVPIVAATSAQRAGIAPQATTGLDGGNMITETADGKVLPSQTKAADGSAKPVIKKATQQTQQGNSTQARPAQVVAANSPRTGQATAGSVATAPGVLSGATPVATGTPSPAMQPAPAPVATPTPVLAQAPAKPVCANCGTIQAVTPVTRPGKGASGVGTVAGGILGGVLGRQVGGGSGKDLATVVGAVGGAVAGNAVEKNIQKETVYSVRVQMEDGSTRTIEQASAPAVGAKVRVEGATLRVDG